MRLFYKKSAEIFVTKKLPQGHRDLSSLLACSILRISIISSQAAIEEGVKKFTAFFLYSPRQLEYPDVIGRECLRELDKIPWSGKFSPHMQLNEWSKNAKSCIACILYFESFSAIFEIRSEKTRVFSRAAEGANKMILILSEQKSASAPLITALGRPKILYQLCYRSTLLDILFCKDTISYQTKWKILFAITICLIAKTKKKRNDSDVFLLIRCIIFPSNHDGQVIFWLGRVNWLQRSKKYFSSRKTSGPIFFVVYREPGWMFRLFLG